MSYQAFISHASADRAVAERLNEALQASGLHTFFAPNDISVGKNFEETLKEAIRASTILVVVLSQNAGGSDWVNWEVKFAKANNRLIAPVKIEKFELDLNDPLYVDLWNVQSVDLSNDWVNGVERLVRELSRECPPSETGGSTDQPPRADAPSSKDAEHAPAGEPVQPPPAQRARNRRERERALEKLKQLASQGDKHSQFLLGRLYLRGDDVPKDEIQAVRLIRLAADGDKGLREAQYLLAECYHRGIGVGRDYLNMRNLHQRAARAGYAPADYVLGVAYEQGLGVSSDQRLAFQHYERSARRGFPPAQLEVANRSLTGNGAQQNDANALSYAQMAARQGYGPALNLMGRLYRNGRGVAQSDAAACEWYSKAMRQGNPLGAFNLSTMYARGLGVPEDSGKAAELYQRYQELLKLAEDSIA